MKGTKMKGEGLTRHHVSYMHVTIKKHKAYTLSNKAYSEFTETDSYMYV